MNIDEKREFWKSYWKNTNDSARSSAGKFFEPFPDILRDLICGAKTRKGTPCKQKGLFINGRCKLHGGLSTGPKTLAGKSKSALNHLNRFRSN